jgi:hypothetical protein
MDNVRGCAAGLDSADKVREADKNVHEADGGHERAGGAGEEDPCVALVAG